MTPDEANQILKAMTAAWPRPEQTRDQVDYWLAKLLPLSYEITLDAVLALTDSEDWWPAWAKVEGRISADIHARANKELEHRADRVLDGPPADRERNLRGIAECRAALRKTRR